MSLKIFGKDGPKKDGGGGFSEDVVGRFRSGHQVESGRGKKKPVALSEWRVTTGDPDVAAKVQDLLGGDEPGEWEATGEDNLEVFTEAPEVRIILEKKNALRQAMILWGRNGNIIRKSDGETISYPEESKGEPDPQADQTLQERKAAAKEGTGAEPQIEVYFRLADDPDLGIWKFQSGSWSMVSDLAYNETQEEIEDLFADGAEAVEATLRLEEVSFEAKSGPMAGKTVTFTKPVLENLQPVE